MRRTLLVLLCALGISTAQEPKVWVHAPAEDLLGLFPHKGAGYLISIDEYRKLVDAARRNQDAARERPPLAARLVHGIATGRIEDDLLKIEANYVALVRGDGPVEVPFPLHDIALQDIHVEGGSFAGGSLRFAKPGTYNVSASLSVRLKKSGELRKAAFRLPPSAGHKLAIDMPAGVEGEVGPIVRAFKTGASREAVIGYPDRNGVFTVWLQPRARAQKLAPLLSVAFDTVASLGEARTVTRTALQLEVLRAPVRGIELLLAKGQTIRALSGKRIKTWRLERGQDEDTLHIVFVEPIQGHHALTLEAELPRDKTNVTIPVVRVQRAVRYRGTIGITHQPEVRVTAIAASGARRLDRLPKGLVSLHETYTAKPTVTATVERIASKTRAFTRAILAFSEGGKRLRVNFFYSIAGKALFRLEPSLPAGWILRHANLDGRAVDHRYEDDGKLVMVFPAGLKPGNHILSVGLDTDEVDWVANEGSAKMTFTGLRSGLDEERGYLVVASDPAFRVSTTATDGLHKVGMPEVAAAGIKVSERVLYAWRFDTPQYAVNFALERHEPQISVEVVNRVMPSERLLRSHATLLFKIERTGVREIKVALPKGTGKLVEFKGNLIKEKRAPKESADPEVWTLVFQKRIRGEYRLDLAFDRKFEDDAWTADIPVVSAPGAQEQGFVVVHSSATTAITVERNGLREADVGELPGTPAKPPLEVLAYAKQPYTVTISSRRHDAHIVVQAIALSAQIYGVLTREGRLRCRAEYRVRNNDQAFLSFALPDGSTLIGALVDGQPAKPLVDKGLLKLPLARSKKRLAPFLVAIIYESQIEALDDTGEITVRRPELNIDVLKTRYTLHLPDGYKLTGHDGDLVPLGEREQETVLGDLALLGSALVPSGKFVAAKEEVVNTIGVRGEPTTPGLRRAGEKRERTTGDDKKKGWERDREGLKKELAKARHAAEKRPARRKSTSSKPKASADAKTKDKAPAESKADKPIEELEVEETAGEDREDFDGGSDDGVMDGLVAGKVAKGGPGRPTPRKGGKGRAAPRRKRPERALLSLDVQFLRPDNVYRLDSLAPTGAVTLAYGRSEVFERRHFIGVVIGAALGLILLTVTFSLGRVLIAGALGILGLHFSGVSWLSADFARGAATAILVALLVALIPRIVRLLLSIRLPRKKAAAGVLLLAATFAQAQDGTKEILVPYSGDNFEKVERVLLPAKEYHRLRKLAFPTATERATVVLSATYRAELKGEELAVTARYEIVKEAAASERMSLRLFGVAVAAATLDGKPATLTVEKNGYVLVLSGKGTRVLELVLRPKLERSGDRRWFRIPVRPVANATMALTHDRSGHEVHPVSLGAELKGVHHIGPVAVVGATWTPKTEGFRAAAAELRSNTESVISLRDGYTAVAARIRYGIAGGTAERFRVRIDKALAVRSVLCANLAGWERGDDGILTVALSKPAKNSHTIEILGERTTVREREENVLDVTPLDVVRDAGVIALETLPDLKVEVIESQGLLRARLAQAPQKLNAAHDRGAIHSVHRFAVRPFRLKWRVFLEQTRLRAETDLDIRVGRQFVHAVAKITVHVERGPGPFGVRVSVPPGYEVTNTSGRLRDWWVKDGTLHLARSRRQAGVETYAIWLTRKGETAKGFEAPVLAVLGAAREAGLIRVSTDEGLELDAKEANNLLPEDIAKVAPVRPQRLRRAYRYVVTPWRLLLATREETREVEAIVVSRVVPLQDHLRVEALVNFYVRRGLVDELSFVVPVTEDALVSAQDLREELSEVVDGGRRYTLRLRTPTRGTASAVVTYRLPYGEPLRGVEPRGVTRVQRYVAVEKVPDGEVKVSGLSNLESGDFDDLPLHPPETNAQSVAGVYVGSGGEFRVDVSVKRHTFEEVEKAVIYRAAAQVVVDRSGFTRTLVTYRVYNRSEQFLELQLPKGALLYSVLVKDEGVRPLKRGNKVLVPLRKVAIGSPTFDVDVVYAYRGPKVGEDDFELRLPEVSGLEVRRSTLSLYVPKGYSYSFDSKMERVEEATIAVGETDDIYQEIKELYDVAERGNKLQALRALGNVRRLESEARRLADKVRTVTRDEATRQQVENRKNQLDALREANKSIKRYEDASRESTIDLGEKDDQRRAQEWFVNDGYLKRNRRDDNKALEDFKEKQKLGGEGWVMSQGRGGLTGTGGGGGSFRGPNGGVPPGFVGPSTNSAIGLAGGKLAELDASKLATGEVVEGKWRLSSARRNKEGGLAFSIDDVTFGMTFQRDFDVEIAQAAFVGDRVVGKVGLRGAAGRLSIKIDLPLEGDVYHFAGLGTDGSVTFAASAEDGVWLEALLGLLLMAGAIFVVRGRNG